MEKMIPAFKSFMGGPLGDGSQWFSWIHILDLVSAAMFLLENPDIDGPVNFCAPEPVRNQELAKTLADILNRPAVIRVPGFAMRLVLGEFGETLLNSTRAIPAKLQNAGFRFEYPDLRSAVTQIVS